MNTVMLNTISLDGGVIIKKGGSGGGGGNTPGGGGSDIPVIGDGKTYLYIKYPNKRIGQITLNFSQSVNYGVYIDWGDGSEIRREYGEGDAWAQHTYEEAGEYVISLSPIDGCVLGLGRSSKSYPVLGNGQEKEHIYSNMIQAVEIGNSVTSIGNYAFSRCSSLSSVVIPNSVTSIGNYAFSRCYSLSSVVIPNSVTSIGNYAFSSCSALSSIVIPNSVTSIGNYAFGNCSALSSIVIPNSVTSIGSEAFYYCYSLSSVVIPNTVTSIGNDTFNYCLSLSSVVIPNSVTSIGNYAFYSCYGIRVYDFSQCTSIPTLGTNAFYGISSDCKIVVPDALYDEWKAATNWSSHASKIVKASEFNG